MMKYKHFVHWAAAALLFSPLFFIGTDTAAAAVPQSTAVVEKEIHGRQEKGFQAGPGIAVVQTTGGKVQGYVRQGIYTYHGIPYAEAKERFKPAQPVQPWQGTRLAMDYGPISTQPTSSFPNSTWEEPARSFAMGNNCQNLNIWTPGINDGKKRPVMVWLHGGGFQVGSSAESPAYDGANLSRRGDVVVVSLNHRLNVLGHLDLSAYGKDYQYSGNVGILDLVNGLKWIRSNIAAFGGDPQNVTIFGESGGGAKVLALMTAPEAKGLFQKGIVESGAVESMGPYFMDKKASAEIAALTLKNLGLTKDQVEQLQTVPYDTLTAASDKALKEVGAEYKVPQALGSGYGMSWEPVIDGDFLPTNPVTKDSFAAAGKDVPLLIGTNRTEWTGFPLIVNMAQSQSDNINTWSDAEIDKRLYEAYGDKTDAVVRAFLKAYPNKTKADALYIDTLIRLPILKIMEHKVAQGGAPVYAYLFSWDSPVMNGIYMSYHTAEIPFVFHNIDKMEARIGDGRDARTLSDRMSDAWIHFARYGTPGTPDLPRWEPYPHQRGATMIFDTTIREGHHHDRELLQLLAPDYKLFE